MREVGRQQIEPASPEFTATFLAWLEAGRFTTQYARMYAREPSRGVAHLRDSWGRRAATLMARMTEEAVEASTGR